MQLLGRNLVTLSGERLSEVQLLQAPFYIMLLKRYTKDGKNYNF
nr:MAG TPA: hypothetical protein [Bacteriophage sp.]